MDYTENISLTTLSPCIVTLEYTWILSNPLKVVENKNERENECHKFC